MILLWGLPEDTPLRRVAEELEKLGAEWMLLDQRHAGSQGVELVCTERIEGTLFDGEQDHSLSRIEGAYIRPSSPTAIRTVLMRCTGLTMYCSRGPIWRQGAY